MKRLKTSKLPTLQYRRLRGTNLMPENEDSTTSPPTRGHSLKLYIQRAEKTLLQHFFSIRVASHWNNLPEIVIEAPTTKVFEKPLDKYWKEHKLIYNYRAKIHYSPIANRLHEFEESTTRGVVDKLEI